MTHNHDFVGDFHSGRLTDAYKYMGAHTYGNETVFRVWAPNAQDVSVVGDFNGWDHNAHHMVRISNDGIYEGTISGLKCFDNYKYSILSADGQRYLRADPYAFHSETRPDTSSKLYDIEGYEWNDKKWCDDSPLFNAARPFSGKRSQSLSPTGRLLVKIRCSTK
ncbi:MAG: hypothetical protein II241_03560, partial [Clostridia bacterium]|nr:hypothetical protein [Clostridia bacterium]